MGVDIGKVTKRQQEEEAKTAAREAGGFRYWSPESGKNRVRLLPPWTTEGNNANQFEREVYMHWKVGDGDSQRSFICPMKTPRLESPVACPVCAFVDQLRATNDPTDDEAAQNIAAKQRFYSNIIDLSDPTYTQDDVDKFLEGRDGGECPFTEGDTKIQVFSYGPMIYKELLDIFGELKLDITDLQEGRDLIVKKEGKGMKTKYRVILEPVPTVVTFVGTKTIEETLINLDVSFKPRSLEDMNACLSGTTAGPPVVAGAPPAQAPVAIAAPAAALPAPTPAAAPAPVAAAPIAVEEAESEGEDEEDGPPGCFKDESVFDEKDAECVGGMKGTDEYDPCPYFQECGVALGKLAKPKARRRRAAAKSKTTPAANALENQMTQALKS